MLPVTDTVCPLVLTEHPVADKGGPLVVTGGHLVDTADLLADTRGPLAEIGDPWQSQRFFRQHKKPWGFWRGLDDTGGEFALEC